MGWFKRLLGIGKVADGAVAEAPPPAEPPPMIAPARPRSTGAAIPSKVGGAEARRIAASDATRAPTAAPPPLVVAPPPSPGHAIPSAPRPATRFSVPAPPGAAAPEAERRPWRDPETVRWHGPGEPVAVGGHAIADGMLYTGRIRTNRIGHGDPPPPCVVDPSLKIATTTQQDQGGLDYWQSYATITPSARAIYLRWLADGRTDPAIDVGYVFLFFYGLERRLLVDAPAAAERETLLAEVERLRSIYGRSGSFAGYSGALLREVRLRATLARADWAHGWAPDPAGDCEAIAPLLRIAVGAAVAEGRRLPFDFAMACMFAMPAHCGGIGRQRMATRVRPAFLALMRIKFAARFPQGLKLRDKAASKLAFPYRAAAHGLHVPPVDLGRRLPDPWDLTWTKLADLCAQAAEDLSAHARHVGADLSGTGTLEALAALPPELRAARHGGLEEIGAWLDALPDVSAAATGEFWRRCRGRDAPTLKGMRAVASLLGDMGYGVEPDPAAAAGVLHPAVGVFRLPKGVASDGGGPSSLAAARLGARLLHGLAADDACPVPTATPVLLRGLDAIAARRVGAFLLSLAGTPATAAALRKAAQAVEVPRRPAAAVLLREIAAAIGAISPRQIALVEAAHDALGEDRAAIYGALHRAAPPRTAVGTQAAAASLAPAAGALDLAAIRRIRAETSEVSAILTEVWREEEVLVVPTSAVPAADDPGVDGLDPAHARLLAGLLARGSCRRDDYEALARSFGLMPDAAAETLNDWAFSRFDEALLEDEGDALAVAVHLSPVGVAA